MLRRLLAALVVLNLVLGPALGAAPPATVSSSAGVSSTVSANATIGANANTTASANATVSENTTVGTNATIGANANVSTDSITANVSTNSTTGNEPPLADAGLDQTVPRDAVVLLDGRGSRDPDGSIAAYEWSIVAPDGSPVAPACANCARTNFTASRVGTYAVTLAVTDDDGATSNDTLFVTVTTGEGPEIAVTGPEEVEVGSSATVTASMTPGAAPLSSVTWTLAGTTLSTGDVAAGQRTANVTHTFPAPGNYTVTATVADGDGLTATGSHTVTVVAASPGGGGGPSPPPAPGPPPGGPSSGGPPPIAATTAPVVRGDQVVTGTRPLVGSYRLDVPGGTGNVTRVEWHAETGRFAGGLQTTRDWEPGDHELFAVVRYRDGSRDVATFPDGDDRVVADPAPNLTVDNLATNGSIRGAATGSDAYENLRRISVTVDGEPVARWPTTRTGFDVGTVRRKRLAFVYRSIEPGEPHDVEIVAEDARGQTAVVQRRLTPVGRPVVVRSEFVNDPVDSYHERIGPERYAAHHVLVVELNGMSMNDIQITMTSESDRTKKLDSSKFEFTNQNSTDSLEYHSYWGGVEPGKHEINIQITNRGFRTISQPEFQVTPSPPELYYTITTDGTPDQGAWGAQINASRSFDPDGTDLEYVWKQGAEPISPDNATAKLSSLQLATLVVEDGYDLRSSNEFFFESNYNPGLGFVEEVTQGPYRPNETVQFRVGTAAYKLPKNTYSVDLGLRTSAGGAEVVEWRRGEITAEDLADSGRYNHKDVGSHVWTGIVAIEASELAREPQMPTVAVYNTELPGTNVDRRGLPGVEVLANAGTYRTNVEVTNLRYQVERPVEDRVTVRSLEDKEQYVEDGYTVEDRTHYATEYLLEELVQVQQAKFETRRRTFPSVRYRQVFLDRKPGWYAAGTKTEQEWREEVEYVWRSSRGGEGTYTGRTKQVRVAAAKFRTMYQFRYAYTTFGGREVTGSYWAFRKRRPDHWATGESKRVKVADAVYETHYQFKLTERKRVTVTKYLAERRVQVQEAHYEWQQYRWTTDEGFAKKLARLNDDYRIGGSSPTYEWTLTKQVGTEVMVVDSYRDEDNVLETRATVSGDVMRRYVDTETLESRKRLVGRFEERFREIGKRTKLEIKESVEKKVK